MITPIRQIASISGEKPVQGTGKAVSANGNLFSSVLRSAIENVRQTDSDVVKTEYLMATGQLDNPAALSIAETKSAIAVEMLVQLRNKSLEAYNELTRINL